jgi:flagellar hook-associated protein 1
MADFLSTGVSGLLAFQRALSTTSHNISNVSTDGYSRQRVLIGTRPAQAYGNGWVGQGANV